MALEKCSDCGTEVSSTARSCPKCGRNLYAESAIGKTTIIILVVVLVIIILIFGIKIINVPFR
jgi:hypothetical protein